MKRVNGRYREAIFLILTMMAMGAMLLTSCKKNSNSERLDSLSSGRSVLDILQNSYSISLFNEAINKAGLTDSLKGSGPFTIYIPDNLAFDSMGVNTAAAVDTIPQNVLKTLVKYHILNGKRVLNKDVAQRTGNLFINWLNDTLYLSRPVNAATNGYGDFTTVNGSIVKEKDILATNGVIHVISTVLDHADATIWDRLKSDTSFSLFVKGLQLFGLDGSLKSSGSFLTLFAPMNIAFRRVGINEANIDSINPAQYKRIFYECYFIPHNRLFISDIFDFANGYPPFAYNSMDRTYQLVLADNGSYLFNPTLLQIIASVNVQAYGLSTASGRTYLLVPQIYDPFNQNRQSNDKAVNLVSITRRDFVCLNGVIQVVNNLLVDPTYTKIHN